MKICVAYTLVCNGSKTTDMVSKFVSTWMEHPPGIETDVLAICNGGPPNEEQGVMLTAINSKFYPRENVGHDIGGFIAASKGPLADYDCVLFCGESVHFWKPGWLTRLKDSWERYGKGMYGVFATHVIRAHLQTTAFATAPEFLREYPLLVKDKASRYEFEHGERALWRRLRKQNRPVKLVTWDGDWNPGQWRLPKNGIWKGDQSDCLMWCNHTQRWFESDEKRKRSWQISADRPFK